MRTHRTGLFLAALALGTACAKDAPTGLGNDGGALLLGNAITISGAANSQKFYTVVVPAGAAALQVTLVGSSGDADLYLRFGTAPLPDTYDCGSAGPLSNETCIITAPAAGTWHIAVIGFEPYSGVRLLAEITDAPTIQALTSGVPLTNQAGSAGSLRLFTITVPAGATSLNISTSGGTGDADLYIRFNAAPSTSTSDCASGGPTNTESCAVPSPSAGVWYVLLEGFAAYSGLTLTATVT